MKNLLMVLIIGLFSIACYSQEIASTAIGGEWNNPKTWQNGKMPDANSDVVINGHVIVKQPISCKNLKIMKDGFIEFAQIKDSSNANITETIDIVDGKFVINDKWDIVVSKIIKTDSAIINNYGSITVGD